MPAPLDPRKITEFDRLVLGEGAGIKAASIRAGVSESWAYNRAAALRKQGKLASRRHYQAVKEAGPLPYRRMTRQAKLAFDDFEYFSLRYYGHHTYGWQKEASDKLLSAVESDRREYRVINVCPGAGKTAWARRLAAWVTVRDRSIRGMIGSRTQGKATKMVNALRHDFMRTTPLQATADQIRLGWAVDAKATLTEDFGVFRPLDNSEPWRQDAFVVVQDNFELTTEKEHTWVAYGLDTDYLGDRVDLAIWDDAQIVKDLSSVEKIENQRHNFDTVAETRLEPRGALLLIQQRLGADDLSRHCLDKVRLPDSDEKLDALDAMSDAEQTEAYEQMDRKYVHIKYPAHFDDRCDGKHGRDALEYPAGCLLSPHRVPWSELRALRHDDPHTYEVVYQQEDTATDDTLVKRVWIEGGTDSETGTLHFGCRDDTRGLNELPSGLAGPLYHLATVDPSPTRFWAIQHWVVAPEAANQVFLMETLKTKMTADRLLDWKQDEGRFVGLMEDWQTESERNGLPIQAWIVEHNGAQRFLLQYDHVRRWCSQHAVNIVPHSTGQRKNDPDYGVFTLREYFRSGRVRLPYRGDAARLSSIKLIDEVLKYPHGMQDDQVMAMWFLTSNIPALTIPRGNATALSRPSWVKNIPDARRLAAVR